MTNATNTTESSPMKDQVLNTLEQKRSQLVDLCRAIHADPELAYEEHRAAARVADMLQEAGFSTSVGAYGLDTAVEAVYGNGDFTVTLCAEYDALPGIGH